MKLDDLFKTKLSETNINAPEGLWNRIENNLNNLPQTNGLEQQSQNLIGNTGATISSTLKVLAVSCGVSIAAITGYIIYDNQKTDSTQETAQTTPQTEQIIQTSLTPTEEIIETPSPETETILTNQTTIAKNTEIATKTHTTQTENTANTHNNSKTSAQNTTTKQAITTREEKVLGLENYSKEIENYSKEIKEESLALISDTKEEAITKEKESTFIPEIIIPNFVSPNNDGINDYFEIKNIESYPNNELVIFTSRGQIIYQATSYNNEWDAQNITQGTYFYKLLIRDGEKSHLTQGSITIKL